MEKIQKTSPNSFFIDENGVTLRDKKEMQDAIATDIEVELQDDAAANKKAKDVDPKSVNLYRFFTVPGTSIKAYLNNPTQAGMTVTTAAQTANVAKTATKAAGGGNTGVTKPAATTIVKAQTASAGTSGAPAALGQFKVMTAASAAAAAATPAAPAKAPASKR